MKTDFDKYISDQIQNIEDNLQVGNWDAFKVCYAKTGVPRLFVSLFQLQLRHLS